MAPATETTLQVNLSAGDIAYAGTTVPAIVAAHRARVCEVIAVVDCCRPQRTKIVDPDSRFPLNTFTERVGRIRAVAERLKGAGILDRVYYLEPHDTLIHEMSRKYLRGLTSGTHDYGGCGLMAYLAAFEVVGTRYLLHYDADMLIYQDPSTDWIEQAVGLLDDENDAVAATPRWSPPFALGDGMKDAPALQHGRPLIPVKGGWRDDWFSTRCFLIDRLKLERYTPFMQGSLLLESLAVKLLKRGFPKISRNHDASPHWPLGWLEIEPTVGVHVVVASDDQTTGVSGPPAIDL